MRKPALRIVHYSTFDAKNGAAKASWRLHDALRSAGHRSRMVVREKLGPDTDVHVARTVGRLRRRWRQAMELASRPPRLSARAHLFNLDLEPPVALDSLIRAAGSGVDVICLHLLTGLLSTRGVRSLQRALGAPVVQVLLDLEPATGGCHHPLDCTRYREGCGSCFQLASPGPRDRSRRTFERKRRNARALPLTLVAPTRWLLARLTESPLFAGKIARYIPLALDTDLFRPLERGIARQVLNLQQESKVIFFGAYSLADERKGMGYLREALERVRAARPSGRTANGAPIQLLVAGMNGSGLESSLPFEAQFTGWIRDDRILALAYQAADIFACPSIHDAGPMMIPEAMLCGTPVVAFETGGAPDLIVPGENGYLAGLRDPESFARGLLALLESPSPEALGAAARAAAASIHAPARVVGEYEELFFELGARAK